MHAVIAYACLLSCLALPGWSADTKPADGSIGDRVVTKTNDSSMERLFSRSIRAAIVDKDNREKFAPDHSVYRRTVTIDGRCTGSMVGRRIVATAAHCIRKSLVFQGGSYKLSQPIYVASVLIPSTHARVVKVDLGTIDAEGARQDDWALLVIDSNFGDRLGYFGVYQSVPVPSAVTRSVSLIGYGEDIVGARIHKGCSILRRGRNGLLFHDCDLKRGASGGPLFHCERENCSLVGIQSGEGRSQAVNSAVSADKFAESLANLREKWY